MKNTVDKRPLKKAQWIARTAQALAISEDDAKELLNTKRLQSVRVNTLKSPKIVELPGAKVFSWYNDGYLVEDTASFRGDPRIDNGELYIQNAASWLPVLALDPKPGERILDVCAAPGGKTSHIAQLAGNKAVITANDNSRPRLHKLRRMLDLLGVEQVTTTLHDATRLDRVMANTTFDKILLDAPCSGEGMMTLNTDKDFDSWSIAQVKRLNSLQKRLIMQAWQLLEPGGILVYSTCTMAPEENEAVVDYLLRKSPGATIEPVSFADQLGNRVKPVQTWNDKTYNPQLANTLRLRPSSHVEAFYVAVIRKPLEAPEADILADSLLY